MDSDNITVEEFTQIRETMRLVRKEFGDSLKAFKLRELLGYGEVMTFSITGIGCRELKDETIPEFYIPNNTNVYRGEVRVKTHTVFVFKGYVFTYEIASWSMALCRYREALDQINNQRILAVNEKVKKGR